MKQLPFHRYETHLPFGVDHLDTEVLARSHIYICMYCTFPRPAIQQTCACKSACPVSLLAFAVMAGKTRLTPFEVGQIAAHASHGLSLAEVASMVTRGDGSLGVSKETVRRALARLKKDKTWRGDRKTGSGRKKATTPKVTKAIAKLVFRERGRHKVTVARVRKQVPGADAVSCRTICRRLSETGLTWLRRRRKTLVSADNKDKRLTWARWVLACRTSTLARWVYTDGTVFYLDRTDEEHGATKRAALGSYVWRMCDRTDALHSDCVGPSSYYKGQGAPVRVWGLLSAGHLYITVLPQGQVMNRWWYAWVVKQRLSKWLEGLERPLLVQDYERCLRCSEPLEAMREAGIEVVAQHPSHSPDLNAIENAWALLRQRLGDTEPADRETREAFLLRLRAAVAWINRNQKYSLETFSSNQKDRAREVIALAGGRTKW